MEALGINLGYLIMQILIITVMMLLLKGSGLQADHQYS